MYATNVFKLILQQHQQDEAIKRGDHKKLTEIYVFTNRYKATLPCYK